MAALTWIKLELFFRLQRKYIPNNFLHDFIVQLVYIYSKTNKYNARINTLRTWEQGKRTTTRFY